MEVSDFDGVFAAAITGTVVLIGYLIQKNIDHKRAVSEKRLQTYSMFLKSMFASIESRRCGQANESSEEIFWKSQVSLYGSDVVVNKLGELTNLLPRIGQLPSAAPESQLLRAFDDLMLAMRKDVTPRSRTSLDELRQISPIYTDQKSSSHPHKLCDQPVSG